MKRILSVSLAGVALLLFFALWPGVARANDVILLQNASTPYSLAYWQSLYQYPDVTTGTILIEYDADGVNATTGTFSAETNAWGDMYTGPGAPTHYVDFDPPFSSAATAYSLNITLDHLGNLAGPQAANSFVMWDDVWDDNLTQVVNNPGVPFLQGRVTHFAFALDGTLFGFQVTNLTGDGVTNGWFTNGFLGINMPAGGTPAGWSGGSFAADFQNAGGGNSDVFNAPEPAGIILALMGVAGVGGVARMNSSRRRRL